MLAGVGAMLDLPCVWRSPGRQGVEVGAPSCYQDVVPLHPLLLLLLLLLLLDLVTLIAAQYGRRLLLRRAAGAADYPVTDRVWGGAGDGGLPAPASLTH